MGAAHGNIDAGTFVLDLGKRWFHDLGGDDYALPGYFNDTPSTGTDRWDYRMRPEAEHAYDPTPARMPTWPTPSRRWSPIKASPPAAACHP